MESKTVHKETESDIDSDSESDWDSEITDPCSVCKDYLTLEQVRSVLQLSQYINNNDVKLCCSWLEHPGNLDILDKERFSSAIKPPLTDFVKLVIASPPKQFGVSQTDDIWSLSIYPGSSFISLLVASNMHEILKLVPSDVLATADETEAKPLLNLALVNAHIETVNLLLFNNPLRIYNVDRHDNNIFHSLASSFAHFNTSIGTWIFWFIIMYVSIYKHSYNRLEMSHVERLLPWLMRYFILYALPYVVFTLNYTVSHHQFTLRSMPFIDFAIRVHRSYKR